MGLRKWLDDRLWELFAVMLLGILLSGDRDEEK